MNEQELRVWVSKKLRIDDLPLEIWEQLDEEGLVDPALPDYNKAERVDLVHDARRLYRIWRTATASAVASPSRAQEQEDLEEQDRVEAEPGEYEMERATAYAEYRAKLAADDPRVRNFRRRSFGGEEKLLTSEQAESFLAKDANLTSLGGVSRRLSRTYPWTEEQVARFMLTGEAPEIVPISGHIGRRWGRAHTYGTITMEVEPWVSPEIVWDAYVSAQKKALGRNNRRIGDRNLALFRFVLRQVERVHQLNLGELGLRQKRTNRRGLGPPTELRGGPSWREMMARWNEQFPEEHAWRYKDVRNFERDFRSTEWRIANPVKA